MMKKTKEQSDNLVHSLFQKTKIRKDVKDRKVKVGSLWCPLRDGITYSFISKFMGCRERTRLAYVEGWTSKHINIALEFGNIFHLMEETAYKTKSKDPLNAAVKKANKYLKDKIEKGDRSAAEIYDLNLLHGVCVETYKQHYRHWRSTPTYAGKYKVNGAVHTEAEFTDDKIERLASESVFSIPYQIPGYPPITLTGMIDGVLRHPISGKLVVKENKTKSQIADDEIDQMLHKDCQTGIYLTAVKHLYGEMPQGVLYDVIRRTNKAPWKKESVKDYCLRIKCDIRERPDFYFMRWTTEITEQDLFNFHQKFLNPVIIDIIEWWDSIKNDPFNPWKTKKKIEVEGVGGAGIGPNWTEIEVETLNVKHWERPFGVYAGSQKDLADDYKNIILHDDYSQYERKESCHPELLGD